MYGGSMFSRSAASDTLQGKAIQGVNEKWGDDFLCRSGRESIGRPVCKKKYAPFCFKVVRSTEESDLNGDSTTADGPSISPARSEGAAKGFEIRVERMFACKLHNEQRKAVIERYGVRKGWEPFGQWSLRKAQERAREVARKLAQSGDPTKISSDDEEMDAAEEEDESLLGSSCGSESSTGATARWLTGPICYNGNCAWKFKSKYDDIYKEMHGHTESEAEDNREC